MQKTTNYEMPLYEATDLANLTDGYNSAITIADAQIKALEDSKADKGAAPSGTYKTYADGTTVFTPSA